MANSPQARKRAEQAVTRRERNMAQRSLVRTHIKKVQKAIAASNDEIVQLKATASALRGQLEEMRFEKEDAVQQAIAAGPCIDDPGSLNSCREFAIDGNPG